MTFRVRISTGAPWETLYGYSRAVRIGNTIEVAGTAAVDLDGNLVAPGDAYAQTKFVLEKIRAALAEAGALMEDVVRTRMFVTDISKSDEIGRAHGEFFSEIRPVSTMVEVSRLMSEGMVVEIEATAVVSQ
jgi:enamine deaminase RidA (YjgF/YER057c/UK114 family)